MDNPRSGPALLKLTLAVRGRGNIRLRGAVAIALFLLLEISAVVTVEAKPKRSALDVRALVEEHCGRCHDGRRETAKLAALKVFDLRAKDWTAAMSNQQLQKVNGRFESASVTADQRKAVAQFVQQKLEERAPVNR